VIAKAPYVCPFYGATVWTIDPVLKKIEAALAALGSTSSGVARRLASMNCKGERGNPFVCPVIAYLRRQPIGKFEVTLTERATVTVTARDGWEDTISLPPAVEWFVMRFDRGEFPDCACATSHAGDGIDRSYPVDDSPLVAESAAELVAR
jgi:hypothetical protein